ncbi:MAG: hypothetical protein J7578_04170, partial [Chitinophagaceae bacterium]|nr:hypothetical protein [Chitinophagaceae bacterium]
DKYVKAYRLYNSYFSTGSTAREKRLRLDSVVQENGLNQTLPGYEFTYNPINLPSRISAAQDTSGYYNGKPNGTNLVPVYGADRSYSIEHAKACVLEKVVYPTGGETRFEYEMKATGGLRIKRLKNYSLGTLSGTKSYEYFDPVGGPGKTFQKDITTYEYYCNGPRPKVEATCSKKVTYSSPMEPLYYSYYGETTERYGRVIEYDEYNGSNGKREFKYGNAGIPSRNGLMGIEDLLYEKNIYRKISSGYELAIKQVNKYYYQTEPNNQTIYLQDSMATGEIRVFGIDFESIKDEFSSNAMECDGPATWSTCYPAMYLSFFYRLVSSPIAIAEEINYSYEGSNVLEHKKQYTYDPANLMAPITITEILSDGSKQTDSLRYPSTYSNITATDALTTGIRNLRDKHVIIPIEKASYQFLPNGTLDRLLYSQFTSFRSDMPLPDTLFILQSVTPLLNYNLSNTISGAVKKDARYTPRITFGKYDGKGNLTEQQFINDLKNSYIWDFNSSLPIATAKNAGADDIAYASFEYDGAGNWIRNGGTLNTSIARTGIRSLTLTSGNTLVKNSLSAANTYSVTYWSRNGSMSANNGSGNLLMTKQGWGLYEHIISGASTITVSGSGVIDDLVLRPVNSDMNIYTFEPLVGIVSQAGVRNMITHYEYDNFRRLIHIRDLDSNILKKISYQTRQIADPTGIWTPTGNTKCKPCDLDPTFLSNILLREERNTNSSSPTYNWLQWVEAGTSPTCVNVAVWQNTATPLRCETPNTGYQEQEQIDINPCSPTFNTLRWAHQNLNCTLCPKPANWQWTGNFRCQKDGTNQNTGIREREYRDVESCGSPTYNQLKWMVYETNLTACPVSGCNNNNCYSPSQKCINNVCTNGIRVNISSYYDSGSGMWQCNYRYEFSDGTYSETLTEYNADPCDI